MLARGNPHVPGDEVEPAFLTVLGGRQPTIPPRSAEAKSSGRRRALADWIASPENPLTARVMANRVWQHHFGRGLVRSSSNFGSLGTPPTHPELLDWLAAAAHRRRLATQAAAPDDRDLERLSDVVGRQRKALAQDPENDLFWRFDMRRLGAEEVRDSMLAVSGQLNLKMFGPGVYPKLSREVLESQSVPGSGWGDSPLAEQNRRSIYIHVKRSLVVPLLAEFDICDTDGSCAVRFSTTQPTQALAMLNGDFARGRPRRWPAASDAKCPTTPQGQVRRALRLALAGPVDATKVDRGLQFIARAPDQARRAG